MGLLGPRLSERHKNQIRSDASYLLPPSQFGFVTFFTALSFAIFCFFLLELLIWILVLRVSLPSTPYSQTLWEWVIQLFSFFSACIIFRAGLLWPRALAFGGKLAILMSVVRRMVFCAIASLIIGLVLAHYGVAPLWRPDLEPIRHLVPKTGP